jgi:hypothetical protein
MGRGLPPEQLAQADFKSDCICTQQSHSLLETMRYAEQTFGWPLHAPSTKRSRGFSSWHGCEAGEPTKREATHDSIVSRIESRQRFTLMLGSTRAVNSVRNTENHQRWPLYLAASCCYSDSVSAVPCSVWRAPMGSNRSQRLRPVDPGQRLSLVLVRFHRQALSS